MEFYGVAIKSGESKKLEAPEDCVVVLQNFALTGCEDGKTAVVSLKVGETTQVVCTLIAGRVPQYAVEIAVDPAEEEAELLVKGAGEVHVTGAIAFQGGEEDFDDLDDDEDMEDLEGEEEDDEEEDEEEEDEEMEDEKPAPPPAKKPAAAPAAEAKKPAPKPAEAPKAKSPEKPAAKSPAAKKPEAPKAKTPAKKDTPKKK